VQKSQATALPTMHQLQRGTQERQEHHSTGEDVNGRIANMWVRPELDSFHGKLVSHTLGKDASGTSKQLPALVAVHR
jgi:hypothetical protein